MKSMRYFGLIGCAAALTLIVGIVHAQMTGRWGTHPDVVSAGKQLSQVPQVVGDWRVKREEPLEETVVQMLQCHGSLSRVYENSRTGDVVSVAVMLGPPGPISVHSPEICYSAQNYEVSQARTRLNLEQSSVSDDEFWEVRLESHDAAGPSLRAIYGWTNSKTWQATENPRFSYGGSSYLYKLQLACPLDLENPQHDPCRAFLIDFLPVLRQHLIESP